MKDKILYIVFLLLSISCKYGAAQDSIIVRPVPIKSIGDIPHKSLWQKWMWIHRSIAFQIMKERPLNYDTAYIKSYYKQLVITIPVATRFLNFSLIDLKTGNKLVFLPNLQYDLGVSVSSKWASFIVNSGIRIFNANTALRGETKYQDYQLNLYGRKITTDVFLQKYKGFYIQNSDSYSEYVADRTYEIRADVNALNIGVSSYYIVNYRRFSYRNSFTFVERQKKSAGSILAGIYYTYFDASGSPSLVMPPFSSSFDALSLIRRGHTHNFGVNLGYIYTRVFLKKWYATMALVQGIGGKQVVYTLDDKSIYRQWANGAGKLHMRLAMGYNSGRYFIGTMGMFDYFLFGGKSTSTFDYSFGKCMLYVGYRFAVVNKERQLLRQLNLIDY